MKCPSHPDRDGVSLWGDVWLCGACAEDFARKIEEWFPDIKVDRSKL